MNDKNKIIDKIKKLLALANNNTNEYEAIASALKAQKLMAEYAIEDFEIQEEVKEEPIEEIVSDVGTGNKWKYNLGSIVAKNFRCKCFYRGRWGIVFFGFHSDALIARQVFEYLFTTGNKLAAKHVRTNSYNRYSTKGMRNAYLAGFSEGVRSKLEKQCYALMLTIPPKVDNAYEEYAKTNIKGTINSNLNLDNLQENATAYYVGEADGKQAVDGRYIEAPKEENMLPAKLLLE